MKKIITLAVSALLALTVFTGCSYTTADKKADASGTLVEVTSQWAGPTLTIKDDWKKVKVEFASVPSALQFVYNADVVNPNDSYGNPFCSYSGGIDKKEFEIDVDAVTTNLKTLDSGITKLASVVFQCTGSSSTYFVTKITATKADDTTEDGALTAPSWGGTIRVIE